jgi:DNA-binding NtrC family response regulator
VDVRLIAMTNRNLRREAAAGRFRADLFYRLSVTALEIPPLRDRDGDAAILLDHFLTTLAQKHAVPPRTVAPDALAALSAYEWPGNVRELRNLAENLLLTGAGPITVSDLPPGILGALPETRGDMRLDETERAAMKRAIESAGGNLSEAARKLGISRSTLHRRLRRE